MTRALRRLAIVLLLVLFAASVTGTASAAHKPKKKKREPATVPVPPTPASALQAVPTDYAHVLLTWQVVGAAPTYSVYRDGTLIGQVSTLSFTDSMRWPQTTYGYRVDAIAGDGSVLSSLTASATTPALPAGGVTPYFSAGGVWNQPVGNAQPVANSSALISYLTAHALHPNMTLRSWGVSVSETQPGQQPAFTVPCVMWSNCTLDAFGQIPIPLTASPDSSGDGHLAVYDPTSGREWDMWQAQKTASSWQAGGGAAVSTLGDGVAPSGTAGGDAANLPLLGGLVRPEEILQGHIDHALVFTMPGVSSVGHVCPATHHDGSTTDPNALLEGMRLQLDPSVDVSQLPIPAWEKTLASAMQTYGMYLRDQGGSLAIFAEDSASRGYDAWSKLGFASGNSVGLAGIPWDKFRVLSAPC
jgi:hypothetical protein